MHAGRAVVVLLALAIHDVFLAAQAKDMTSLERGQVESMLLQVSSDLMRHYYDPKLHGVDWQARVRLAREQIKKEKSLNMAMAHVAAALDSLNDSHTFLIPPPRPYVLDHGWTIQTIGEKCFVTHVRPKGDADTNGVKPGDQLVAINGYHIARDNLWKIEFAFNVLRPLPQLTLRLRNPQGEERTTVLNAKFRQRPHMRDLDDPNTLQNMDLDEENWEREQRIRTVAYGDDLLVAKVPSFLFGEGELNKLMSAVCGSQTQGIDSRPAPKRGR
jgi:hypothetical protein